MEESLIITNAQVMAHADLDLAIRCVEETCICSYKHVRPVLALSSIWLIYSDMYSPKMDARLR